MKHSSKKLTINALSSVLQVLFTALLFFFLYKYLLNTIGIEQLGVWSLILSFSSIANLANMGLTSGLVKFVAEYILDEDKSKLGKLIFTSVISMSILFGTISIIIFFGAQFFLRFLIDEKFLGVALQILPYSLASLSINAVGGVFTSVLEGYQKNYIRNFIYIGSGITMFGITVLLTPIYGLKGVAVAQLAQAISVLILAFCSIIKIDYNNRIGYWKWNLQSFKELFSYGYKFQIVSICQLLYEPTTKFLLSKYGGLSFLGHYEMATRAVSQFRALLVNANQVVIPVVAEKAMGEGQEKLMLFYIKMNRVMHLFTFPLSTLLVLVTPLISTIWIGYYEPEFVWSVYILAISYIINIMSGPSYFSCLGEGNLNILILSHLGMAIINIMLGFILGVAFGGVGIVTAWGASIIIGSLITFFLYQKKKQLKFRDIFTSVEFWTTVISFIFLLGGILLFYSNFISIYLMTVMIVLAFFIVNGWYLKKNNLIAKLSELKK